MWGTKKSKFDSNHLRHSEKESFMSHKKCAHETFGGKRIVKSQMLKCETLNGRLMVFFCCCYFFRRFLFSVVWKQTFYYGNLFSSNNKNKKKLSYTKPIFKHYWLGLEWVTFAGESIIFDWNDEYLERLCVERCDG